MFKKIIAFSLLFLISQQGFARTYIQCRSLTTSDDLMVVNINKKRSTLFLTNGVHRPDEVRVVKTISYVGESDTHHIYHSEVSNNVKEVLEVPSNGIEVFNNNFQVTMSLMKIDGSINRIMEFSCFNNILED